MNINKSKLKDTALFAYVVLTVLGAYTAFVFYAGTQAHASSAPQLVTTARTSK